MPGTWRVRVIEEHLCRDGLEATIVQRSLFDLCDAERDAVLDAMTAEGAELPMVLVNDVVACHTVLDIDAVMRAARA